MIELIPIENDMEISNIADETVKEGIKLVLEYYNVIGFEKPWISYIIRLRDKYAGMCSFKGKPINNKVEIAYYTFAGYEGKGIATKACKQLVSIAHKQDAGVIISARTLPEKNASTHLLEKIGFKNTGTVIDIEDGNVFEWIYQD